MGNPALGSKVETTMSLSKGKHLQSVCVGTSPQSEMLGKLEYSSSSEKLTSGAALSPRIIEEQAISAFLGDKKMKRRTRSSQGLELNGVATGLSSAPIGKYQFQISIVFPLQSWLQIVFEDNIVLNSIVSVYLSFGTKSSKHRLWIVCG